MVASVNTVQKVGDLLVLVMRQRVFQRFGKSLTRGTAGPLDRGNLGALPGPGYLNAFPAKGAKEPLHAGTGFLVVG